MPVPRPTIIYTKVKFMRWIEKEVNISEIQTLLNDGFEIEVDSPDGWVGVNFFINKGFYEEYVLTLNDPRFEPIRCNCDHLFETTVGWVSAHQLCGFGEISFLTKYGYVKGEVKCTGETIPIVDINVNHENHRYYTQDVSSHNTGVGKTLMMCHFAASNLIQGKNVLYITLEMAEERISERIDANLMNIPLNELETTPKETYLSRIDRLRKKTQGKLIVKEYPTASAGAGHFRHLLNELRMKKDFVPDIIYIDYLNLCSSSRLKLGSNVNSYAYIKAIAEELRGLAIEFDLPIFSATQTNRTGFGSSDVGLEDTSESFGLPQTADFMIAAISGEELESLGQLMIKQLKNRYNDPALHRRFVIGVDRSRMKLFDVEQNAQENVMKDDGPIMDKGAFGSGLKREKKEYAFDDWK
jgi:hypothetical protein